MSEVKELATGEILVAPSPARNGTSITVSNGSDFPDPEVVGEYELAVWSQSIEPTPNNYCEIVKVIGKNTVGDNAELDIVRGQEKTIKLNIKKGWKAYHTVVQGGGGGGGTSNYNELSNKPRIGGVTLQGNKSLADLGIENYDDTALAARVAAVENTISIQETAIDGKVDKVTGKHLSTNDYTNADKAIVDSVTTNLADKVDKETGKGLSTNDYTDSDKTIVSNVTSQLANKVDKVSGKDLSTNDFTTDLKDKLDGLANIKSIGAGLTLEKNTGELKVSGSGQAVDWSDIENKPDDLVQDASYTHTDNNYTTADKTIVDGVTAKLDDKVDKETGKGLSTNDYSNADKAIVDNVTANLAGKVDKEANKGLSTNDFTTELKNKLDGIEAEANKTIVDSSLSTTSENPLQNKVINTALGMKADTSDVLTKTNTTAFTPTADYHPATKKYVDDHKQDLASVLAEGATASNQTITITNGEDQTTGELLDGFVLESADKKRSVSVKPDEVRIKYADTIVNPQDPTDTKDIGFEIYNMGSDIYITRSDMAFGEHDNFNLFLGADHMSVYGYRDTDPQNPQDLNNFSMEWGEVASVSMSDDLKTAWQSALGSTPSSGSTPLIRTVTSLYKATNTSTPTTLTLSQSLSDFDAVTVILAGTSNPVMEYTLDVADLEYGTTQVGFQLNSTYYVWYVFTNSTTLTKAYGEHDGYVKEIKGVKYSSGIVNYSTEEQVVGTWINGKTIYRRVIATKTALGNSVEKVIWTADVDIDEVIDFSGMLYKKSTTSARWYPFVLSGFDSNNQSMFAVETVTANKKGIVQKCSGVNPYINYNCYIILTYTKL